VIESELGALFGEIADGEPATTQVDPQLAHHRGRVRLRWRRACAVAIPVLTAAAVVVALVVGVGPERPAARPALGPGAPHQFSLLDPYLSFGWLPAGMKLQDGDILRQVVSIDGARKPWGSNDPVDWEVSAYAAGQCHLTAGAKGLKCASAAYGQASKFDGRAPDVAGHHAYWSGYWLIWEYAPGGWAFLTAPFPAVPYKGPKRTPKLVRQAVRIASNIRYGRPTPPLLYPVQLSGLPSRWQVSSVFYVPQAGVLTPLRFALTSSKPDPGADGGLEYQKGLPTYDFDPLKSCPRYTYRKGFSDTSKVETVLGHRVVLTTLPRGRDYSQSLCAAHADGLSLFVSVQGKHPPMSPLTLFRDHLRLLGPNPANWIAQPIG
jgi:hypothetical protein